MSSTFPDIATIRTVLSLAIRAPSMHNTQPWRWRVGEHSLQLHAERSLQLTHADPDSRDLIISCGGALNHCTIALAALGWQCKVHRIPNPADPYHLASVELQQGSPNDVDVALAAAIPRRRTDRRLYGPWRVSYGDIALMGARTARMGVTMRRVVPTPGLNATLALAVHEHVNDADYLVELAKWSRRYAATAGVPARNSPDSVPGAAVPGRLFAGATLAQPPEATVGADNGVLLALGTAEDDVAARLRAGEATSVLLLTATALGMATCPITEPLEIAATRDAIQTEVFGVDAFPQMLIRVGWAPANADPLPATPRRDVADVVTMLDGAAFF